MRRRDIGTVFLVGNRDSDFSIADVCDMRPGRYACSLAELPVTKEDIEERDQLDEKRRPVRRLVVRTRRRIGFRYHVRDHFNNRGFSRNWGVVDPGTYRRDLPDARTPLAFIGIRAEAVVRGR
jgi:hypothetical protein